MFSIEFTQKQKLCRKSHHSNLSNVAFMANYFESSTTGVAFLTGNVLIRDVKPDNKCQ